MPETADEPASEDLVAFLTARLDEDEAAADDTHAAECWSCSPDRFAGDSSCTCAAPARVLREVAAKRLIIAAHNTTVRERMRSHPEYGQDYWCDTCSHENPAGRWCRTLLLLASAWSDHPDYRQEWKP